MVVAEAVSAKVCWCTKGSELEPLPHALAFAETVPSAATWRHRVPDPPVLEMMRPVVEAFVTERFVVVAEVVVEKLMERPWVKVEEAPLKSIDEVVAEIPAAGWVKAS